MSPADLARLNGALRRATWESDRARQAAFERELDRELCEAHAARAAAIAALGCVTLAGLRALAAIGGT